MVSNVIKNMKTRFVHKIRQKVFEINLFFKIFDSPWPQFLKLFHEILYHIWSKSQCRCCISSVQSSAGHFPLLMDTQTIKISLEYGWSSSQEQSFYFFEVFILETGECTSHDFVSKHNFNQSSISGLSQFESGMAPVPISNFIGKLPIGLHIWARFRGKVLYGFGF